MAFLMKKIKWLHQEFGLESLYNAGRDAWLIILTRCCRMFAYGTNSLIIALFFSAVKFSDSHIGLFMTLTLLGDVMLSLLLTLVADRVGRRRILFAGSFLMVISGATFAISENFWILLIAAVVGVISPTGSEIGPFRAVEESTLSHLTTPKTRSDVLAWYVTIATLGSSLGTEISGQVVEYLQSREGWTIIDAYHTVFWVYTCMGLINMILTLCMSEGCEMQMIPKTEEDEGLLEEIEEGGAEEAEEAEEVESNLKSSPVKEPIKPKKKGVFAQISPETRMVMVRVCSLFAIDSLGSGMTPYSLINYYIDQKFHLPKSTLGTITSVSYFLSAFSTIFAGPMARRLGLVNTMVFTHLPSSVALALIPAPSGITMTVALLLFRASMSSMDQAPRAAFVAAVVKPEERTAVMGINSMLRTLAQSSGPSVTGVLAGNDKFWIAFVAAGALKASYDVGIFSMFMNMRLHQHEGNEPASRQTDPRRENDEEELRTLPKR